MVSNVKNLASELTFLLTIDKIQLPIYMDCNLAAPFAHHQVKENLLVTSPQDSSH